MDDAQFTKFQELLTERMNTLATKVEALNARSPRVSESIRRNREKLEQFYSSEFAKMTVKELTTSTSNVSLATLVQSRALLELKNWIDARDVCMLADAPKGAGKTIDTQIITKPTFGEWTEGSALSAADPTLTNRAITLKPFGKVTQITDLLANTSAVNFIEQMGLVHGACVREGIFHYVATALSNVAGGTLSAASGAVLTFVEVASAIKATAVNGFHSDFIFTSATNMWTAFTTTYAVTQFTGALATLLAEGTLPRALGLDWMADPYWDTLFPAAQKVLALVGTKGMSAVWGALQTEPLVEIYRVPTELSNYVITHMDGGSIGGIANSVEKITYAS